MCCLSVFCYTNLRVWHLTYSINSLYVDMQSSIVTRPILYSIGTFYCVGRMKVRVIMALKCAKIMPPLCEVLLWHPYTEIFKLVIITLHHAVGQGFIFNVNDIFNSPKICNKAITNRLCQLTMYICLCKLKLSDVIYIV